MLYSDHGVVPSLALGFGNVGGRQTRQLSEDSDS
jgi:hypothetical protein